MKLRPFELTMIIVFGTMFLLAILLLSTFKPKEDASVAGIGTVTIWGTFPALEFNSLLDTISRNDNKGFTKVSYVYVPPEDLDNRLLNALADQKSPDLVLLSHERLVKHRNRLQVIPYENFPLVDYRNLYVDGAEVFALQDGIYGFPIAVDPLVMYWNRDIFSSEGFLNPPQTWEEMVSEVVPTITVRDFNREIKRSAVAMGEYANINHAFQTMSMLLIQGGSLLVGEKTAGYVMNLNATHSEDTTALPLNATLSFFTNFNNVNNTLYSWNRTLGLDRDMFLSEDLALYFGYASEGEDIQAKNPNLNFGVAEVPQGAASTIKRTYGNFYSFVIPKASKNINGAFLVAQFLSGETYGKTLADMHSLAPVNRNALRAGNNDIYGRVAYLAAVKARGWLNPDMARTDEIFTKVLGDINANRKGPDLAASDAIFLLGEAY